MANERQLMWAIIEEAPTQVTPETGEVKPSPTAINAFKLLEGKRKHLDHNAWNLAIGELSNNDLFKLTYTVFLLIKSLSGEALLRGGYVAGNALYQEYVRRCGFQVTDEQTTFSPELKALHRLIYDQQRYINTITPVKGGAEQASAVEVLFSLSGKINPPDSLVAKFDQNELSGFDLTLPPASRPMDLEEIDLHEEAEIIASLEAKRASPQKKILPHVEKLKFLNRLKEELDMTTHWETLGHGIWSGQKIPDGIMELQRELEKITPNSNSTTTQQVFAQVQTILEKRRAPLIINFFGLRTRDPSVTKLYNGRYLDSLELSHDFKNNFLSVLKFQVELATWDNAGHSFFGGTKTPDGIVKLRQIVASLNSDSDTEAVNKAFQKAQQLLVEKQKQPTFNFLGAQREKRVTQLYKGLYEASQKEDSTADDIRALLKQQS